MGKGRQQFRGAWCAQMGHFLAKQRTRRDVVIKVPDQIDEPALQGVPISTRREKLTRLKPRSYF